MAKNIARAIDVFSVVNNINLASSFHIGVSMNMPVPTMSTLDGFAGMLQDEARAVCF